MQVTVRIDRYGPKSCSISKRLVVYCCYQNSINNSGSDVQTAALRQTDRDTNDVLITLSVCKA
jgi:hypothetical protein